MNINPISFGRIARVQAPYSVAKQAVELINKPEIDEDHTELQGYLKDLFYDYRYGAAMLAEPRKDEFYILSGNDANEARLAKEKMEDKVDLVWMEEGYLEACDKEAEFVHDYQDELESIIAGPREFPEELIDENTTEEESDAYIEAYWKQQDYLNSHPHPVLDIKYDDDMEILDAALYFED